MRSHPIYCTISAKLSSFFLCDALCLSFTSRLEGGIDGRGIKSYHFAAGIYRGGFVGCCEDIVLAYQSLLEMVAHGRTWCLGCSWGQSPWVVGECDRGEERECGDEAELHDRGVCGFGFADPSCRCKKECKRVGRRRRYEVNVVLKLERLGYEMKKMQAGER